MTLRERIERYIVTNGGNPKNVHDVMNFFMDAFHSQNDFYGDMSDDAIAFVSCNIDIQIDYAEDFLNAEKKAKNGNTPPSAEKQGRYKVCH